MKGLSALSQSQLASTGRQTPAATHVLTRGGWSKVRGQPRSPYDEQHPLASLQTWPSSCQVGRQSQHPTSS